MKKIIPKVVVQDGVEEKIASKIKKEIEILLKTVPSDCLNSLSKVIISNVSTFKKKPDAAGLYYQKSQNNDAYIVICAETIFNAWKYDTPWYMMWLVTFRWHVMDVLYHEIGHHMQYISHGFKKETQENHAENFSSRLKSHRFNNSLTAKLTIPLRWLLRLLFGPIARKMLKNLKKDIRANEKSS